MIRISRAALFMAALGATATLSFGGAEAKSAAVGVPLKVATTSPAAPEIAPVVPLVAATPVPIVSVPACARRVKMIYTGYGEAARASCDAPEATATR